MLLDEYCGGNVVVTSDNLFNMSTEALVNPVNCKGVMGVGLALQFKNRYPEMFDIYKSICLNENHSGLKHGGDLWAYIPKIGKNKWILNVATKEDWRHPSELRWIDLGVQNIYAFCDENKIESVAMPYIGCGCGGLHKDEVLDIITNTYDVIFGRSPKLKVYVCDYKK